MIAFVPALIGLYYGQFPPLLPPRQKINKDGADKEEPIEIDSEYNDKDDKQP